MKNQHYKLDRTAFEVLKFDDANKKIQESSDLNEQERFNQFKYLMSVAYRFLGEPWPRMDKTVFEARKRS